MKGYDYSRPGLYFITICIQDKKRLLGNIVDGKMYLNDAGKMVENEWLKIPIRFPTVQLHKYVIMPDHFHAIMEITAGGTLVVTPDDQNTIDNRKGNHKGCPATVTVGRIIGAFQSIVTVEYIRGVKNIGWQPFNGKLWQRNYYEHIIRDEKSYHRISEYIVNNPINWKKKIKK